MTASVYTVGPGKPPLHSPKGERTARFSLSEGESQGENQQRILDILKILDEKAAAAKEQGKAREIVGAPEAEKSLAPETLHQNPACGTCI
ncbi:MAG TPA: hypothetical protein VHX61_09500 [Rhizomicrobium sp.]|jgi:hypothetical protein|nr:hypothetical protein [Rhizomicrobium sp.]